MHKVFLKQKNFVSFDMYTSLQSNGGSTLANSPDNQSSIIFGSAKSSFRLRTYSKEKKISFYVFQHLLAKIYMYILVIFMSPFLRITGNFLLNNGVDKCRIAVTSYNTYNFPVHPLTMDKINDNQEINRYRVAMHVHISPPTHANQRTRDRITCHKRYRTYTSEDVFRKWIYSYAVRGLCLVANGKCIALKSWY